MCFFLFVSACKAARATNTSRPLETQRTTFFFPLRIKGKKNHTHTLNLHRSQTFFCPFVSFVQKPTSDDDSTTTTAIRRRKKRRIFLILISKNLPQRADDGGAGAGAHFLLRSSRLLRAPLSRSFLFRARRSAFIRGRERRLKK